VSRQQRLERRIAQRERRRAERRRREVSTQRRAERRRRRLRVLRRAAPVTVGAAALSPLNGFDDIYTKSDTLYSVFTAVTFTY